MIQHLSPLDVFENGTRAAQSPARVGCDQTHSQRHCLYSLALLSFFYLLLLPLPPRARRRGKVPDLLDLLAIELALPPGQVSHCGAGKSPYKVSFSAKMFLPGRLG
jgi:hypothetical protein